MKRLTSIIISLTLLATLFLSVSFSVNAAAVDTLKGTNISFVGDDTTIGFEKALDKVYGLNVTCHAGGSGVTLSDWRKSQDGMTGSGVVHNQLLGVDPKATDYVILCGGFADMETQNLKKGNVVVTDNTEGVVIGPVKPHDYTLPVDEMDAKNAEARTFSAGVERLIKYAITKCDGKRIGFIIGWATPFNKSTTARTPDKYWEVVRQTCDKWNVPYLDLFSGTASDGRSYSKDILDLYNEKSPFMSGGKKSLSDKGYETIAPYVAEWMATLQPYNLKAAMATANTTTLGTGKTLPTTTTTTTTKVNTPGTTTTTTTTTASLTPPTTSKKQVQIEVVGNGEAVTRPTTTTTTEAVTTDPLVEDGLDSTTIIIIAGLGALAVAINVVIVVIVVRRKKKKQ